MNKKLSTLKNKKKRLIEKLHSLNNFVRGSITTIKHKCSNKNCECHSGGKKHPGIYFSVNINKKTKLIYLGKKKTNKAKKMLSDYKKLKKLLDEIVAVNLDILKLEE